MERLKTLTDQLARGDAAGALESARAHLESPTGSPEEKASSLARILERVYANLVIPPVHQFLRDAPASLGPERAGAVMRALETAVKRTHHWSETLASLRKERLAREMRAMVRDKRLKEAAALLRAIVLASKTDEEKESAIGYLAGVLGTLDHDQDQVKRLLGAVESSPEAFGLTKMLAKELVEAEIKQNAQLRAMSLEGREREFARALTQAIVDLRNSLTLVSPVGEPTEEETAALFEDLLAIFRAVAGLGQADLLIDATLILVEITPRDPRSVGPAVEGEQRLFLSLTPRQKLCAVRALRKLGAIPRLRAMVLKFAESASAALYTIPLVEVMGGLGSAEFRAFVEKTWRDKSIADPRFSCIDALGRLEDEAATGVLMERLTQLLRSRPFDPPKRREAEALTTAVGRIARHPTLSAERRNQIVADVVRLIPPAETQMGWRAAADFFSYKPEALDEHLIGWAMERIAQALWTQDQRPDFARTDSGETAALGYRHAFADLAIRIGSRGLPHFLQALEPFVDRYSGAYIAVAEILEKIGDRTAFPMLRKMALTAWLVEEGKASKYFAETYFDPADQAVKPLTKDKVIHSLIFTISKLGGREGRLFLVGLGQQIRAKRQEAPGNMTAALLMEILMKSATEPAGDDGEADAGPMAGVGAVDTGNPLADAHSQELIEIMTGRYLLAKNRRASKIPAIQEAGRRRDVGMLETLISQLDEKDEFIRAAAVAAIQEFAGPGATNTAMGELGQTLLNRLKDARDEARAAIREVLMQINPRREPFKGLILQAYENAGGGAIKSDLSHIVRTARIHAGMERADDPAGLDVLDFAGAAARKPGEASAGLGPPAGINELEAKRLYFIARRAWIAGGKKGDPPKPPE